MDSFYVHRGWRDGLHPYCKPCLLAYQSARRHAKLDAADPNRRRWTRRFVRHDYFATIDSEIKAYVLGLLAADGNVIMKPPRVSLELHEKDSELVELVCEELAPEARIRRRRPRGSSGPQMIFSATSRQVVADLCELGVGPRKSLTLEWPTKLPREFARPFLLGYFDGDGFTTTSRSSGKYAYSRWGLCGTDRFLVAAMDVITCEIGIRRRNPHRKSPRGIWTLAITGIDAERVDEWLHSGPPEGLRRKRLSANAA